MREIVYFWVKKFRNIENQGLNFGSEYQYYVEIVDDKYSVKRKRNDLYIKNFFHKRNKNSIVNISAIVGHNGAGKSNFIDALKFALTTERYPFEFVIIYKNENGDVSCDCGNNFEISCDFEQVELTTPCCPKTIYYNPALDSRIYPITHDESPWIDISTDWLIFRDFEEQKETKPDLSQIELFYSQEIHRQLKLTYDSDFTSFISKKINIPSEVRMVSIRCDFPSIIPSGDTNKVRNVPYAFRPYYNIIKQKLDDEINKHIREPKDTDVVRQQYYIDFLGHLLKNIFYHFELTNLFLTENKIDIDKEEFKEYEYEEAIYSFLRKNNLIEYPNKVIDFIEYTKELILTAEVEFSYFGETSWVSPKEKLNKFLELQDGYLSQLSKFTHNNNPRGFISYSWWGLSNGEKAMLNLFSRFYYAKLEITKNPQCYPNNEFPRMIYLLIDEAELGFHLQWQKEYINNIVDFIPEIFVFNSESGKVFPIIQIIFTTHSTLSLSDIPNTHISYIKNRDSKAYVLEGKERPTKSFGANVHSLMSDSFFLQNGLVGSFAVEKINEIISILNSKNEIISDDIKYVESVIEIIDEPILNVKLKKMLSKRKNPASSELEKLELQKKEIEIRIQKLKEND